MRKKLRKTRCERLWRAKKRGCGKVCGKGGKLARQAPATSVFHRQFSKEFSAVEKRGRRLNEMSYQIPLGRRAAAGFPKVFPRFQTSFRSVFPRRTAKKAAFSQDRYPKYGARAVFHSSHSPYYDYYYHNLSILPFFLSPTARGEMDQTAAVTRCRTTKGDEQKTTTVRMGGRSVSATADKQKDRQHHAAAIGRPKPFMIIRNEV